MTAHRPRLTHAGRTDGSPSELERQAFTLLRTAFTVAPIVFGLDKATNQIVDWPIYLAPQLDRLVPGTAQQAMWLVGVVEVIAGLAVAVRPRFGAPLVAAWLAGIVLNLLLLGDHYDVALRDVGLLIAALALWRLAVAHGEGPAADRTTPGSAARDGVR